LSANLDLEQFHEYVEANRGLILDARPELFHRLGHVPGAISLPRESFSATYEKIKGKLEHNKGQPIVVYCSELTCEDSVMVQSALVQLGFTHVSVFRGGWDEWTQAGFPTERN
jgi:rhodanese-related sulfurtransferase